MTARDFTPTDEQVEARAGELYHEATGKRWDWGYDKNDRLHRAYLATARDQFTSPAFQSIIAAAKAEALREGFMQASILVDRWGYPTLSDDLDRHSPYREASA